MFPQISNQSSQEREYLHQSRPFDDTRLDSSQHASETLCEPLRKVDFGEDKEGGT